MATKRNYRGAPTNGAAQGGSASSEDEERAAPSPPQRTSARRQPRVDLSRLETGSLRKYRRVYKLGDLGSGVSKEDLVPAVARHWQSQVVEEEYETLLAFAMTLRKQYVTGQSGTASKVKQKPGPKPRSQR
uniref:Histone deacetylase complex subunit SAP30 Sin3 binding domain-containing protein n=1 Tax=Pyramimonas obovata TaxID=1411642 RepID=A0A7S0QTE5_9CHLO|mmetsp:Transcript_19596/g.42834  ORF Transcript_19596/g.42834 Transcript_19596/m.42834 type:complete len:131 (+) Transcript_19596:305-697(+)|eukprot:CAMPEP_0118933790 /NCGR_PEP_ID=MMETSP1169-20130426/12493_1 /TAXON_ID=36882 /ORGANISM="Pyramimonas obovata, Strain CCMP722" /LENGTH=130 /DNA_ID=CAMNT_0006876599 /DNA_START=262 /DNA_END=654 /DNA_ORIENTATION=-